VVERGGFEVGFEGCLTSSKLGGWVGDGCGSCSSSPRRKPPPPCPHPPPLTAPTATLAQCAGFLPRDPIYSALLSDMRVAVPSLFILGESDALVPPERTLELLNTFDPSTAELLRHPGVWVCGDCVCGDRVCVCGDRVLCMACIAS